MFVAILKVFHRFVGFGLPGIAVTEFPAAWVHQRDREVGDRRFGGRGDAMAEKGNLGFGLLS
jgi:hypothetical protein